MISVAPPALHHALQLLRTPTGARPSAHERLPEGMLLLIRIVAGDELALAEARQRSEEPGEVVREAAAFYIQQVMFASGSHSYRLLGVDADAPDERIKEHYRWLVRWLHPDRNADEWEVVYADRVNRAWQDLRTPSRRQRFDDLRAAEAAGGAADARVYASGERPVVPMRHASAVAPDYGGGETGYNALRWLPKLIFGGLGVSAVLALGLLWLLRAPAPEIAPQASTVAAAQDVPAATNPVPSEPMADVPAAVAVPVVAAEASPPEQVPTVPAVTGPDPVTTSPDPIAIAVAAPKPEATKPQAAKPVAPAVLLAQQSPGSSRSARPKTEPTPAAAAPRKGAAAPVQAARESRRTSPSAPAAAAIAAQEAPVAVASLRRETRDAEPGLPTIDDRVANRLVGQLSQAYGDGDLQRMRSLVTSNAIGGSGDLLDEYDRLFASSEQRSLSISNVSWLQDGDNATIIATYVATVQARAGKRPRRTGGDMRLDLRVEGGQWRIYRLSHDDRRG